MFVAAASRGLGRCLARRRVLCCGGSRPTAADVAGAHSKGAVMGIEDMVNKGKGLLGDEEKTDKILDSARDGANKVTGDKFTDQIQ